MKLLTQSRKWGPSAIIIGLSLSFGSCSKNQNETLESTDLHKSGSIVLRSKLDATNTGELQIQWDGDTVITNISTVAASPSDTSFIHWDSNTPLDTSLIVGNDTIYGLFVPSNGQKYYAVSFNANVPPHEIGTYAIKRNYKCKCGEGNQLVTLSDEEWVSSSVSVYCDSKHLLNEPKARCTNVSACPKETNYCSWERGNSSSTSSDSVEVQRIDPVYLVSASKLIHNGVAY